MPVVEALGLDGERLDALPVAEALGEGEGPRNAPVPHAETSIAAATVRNPTSVNKRALG